MRRDEWRPPPGWPEPPGGFVPEVGWGPDPTWPPAPADWKWWSRAPRTPWQRVWFSLLIGLPSLAIASLAVLLLVVQVLDDRAGCGSIDPTDPANYSAISILNDTFEPVIVDECAGDYCRADRPTSLAPGQELHDQAACAATGSGMTSWRITDPSLTILGYVAVDTPRKRDGQVFVVSDLSTSRDRPTVPREPS
jgi:hypothetical protein